MTPLLLIGGLDPSGGAGLVADIETAHAYHVRPYAVATALTVQHDQRYLSHDEVPIEIIEQQLETLFENQPPHAIKIGMIPSLAVGAALARFLKRVTWRGPCIWDPVLTATSGGTLFPLTDLHDLIPLLSPYVTGLTPNLPEAEILSGFQARTPREMIRLIHTAWGSRSSLFILLKGGHGHGERETVVDLLHNGARIDALEHARIQNPVNTRGTGCRLATAIAAQLARGYDIETAVKDAQAAVMRYLIGSPS